MIEAIPWGWGAMSAEVSFWFTLSVARLTERWDSLAEDLAAHGCADAQPGPHVGHRIRLGFQREGVLPGPAMRSALHAVREAIPDAVVLEAGPDLLELDEIAALVALPVACFVELRNDYFAGFPAPALQLDDVPRWHAAHVLEWVMAVGAIAVDATVLETTRSAMELNLALHQRRLGFVA
jgi:hypothetical protein